MSLRTMRVINSIGFVLTLAALGYAFVSIVRYSGALDSSLAVSLGPLGFVGIVVIVLFAKAIRERRGAPKSLRTSRNAFAVILPSNHRINPISSEEEINTVLRRLVDNPGGLGRIVRGGRCRDCGHEEVVLQNTRDELYVITAGMKLVDLEGWFFGIIGMRLRQELILPLARESAEN